MANSNWFRPQSSKPVSGTSTKLAGLHCECCGTAIAYSTCYCMIETLCSGCNHCVEHCRCAQPVAALPYPMQLGIAKHELRMMGVMI